MKMDQELSLSGPHGRWYGYRWYGSSIRDSALLSRATSTITAVIDYLILFIAVLQNVANIPAMQIACRPEQTYPQKLPAYFIRKGLSCFSWIKRNQSALHPPPIFRPQYFATVDDTHTCRRCAGNNGQKAHACHVCAVH